jgi:hypothetical protein
MLTAWRYIVVREFMTGKIVSRDGMLRRFVVSFKYI